MGVTETAQKAREQQGGNGGDGEQFEQVSQALVAVDRVDDAIIIGELQGRVVAKWAYTLKGQRGADGKPVTGLSIAGVSAVTRQMAAAGEALRVIDFKAVRDETGIDGFVVVGRFLITQQDDGSVKEVMLDTAIGTKREEFKKWGRSAGYYVDPFCLEKAISKAQRNACEKMLDQNVKQQVLAMALAAPDNVALIDAPEQKAGERAAKRQQEPQPSDAELEVKQWRGRFHGIAREERKLTQAQVHSVLGLTCKEGLTHPENGGDTTNKCKALSEYVQSQEKPDAEVWEFLTTCLQKQKTIEEQQAIVEQLAKENAPYEKGGEQGSESTFE